MVRSKVACLQSADENVLVALQLIGGVPGVYGHPFTITEFPDENALIQAIVFAGFEEDLVAEFISRVLLAAAGRSTANPWLSLMASLLTYESLGLRVPIDKEQSDTDPALVESREDIPDIFETVDMNIALEQTPVPLCLVAGPEHRYVFFNDAYLRLTGRRSTSQLLGKTLREVYSEEEGRPFFDVIDHTFRTGESFVGKEMHVTFFSDATQRMEDHWMDFVYHPIRDRLGNVTGILCQAAEVTDRVLDQNVREAREMQLYQQWAELDSIYRTSPCAMTLLRASDFRIQRINPIQAAMLGEAADSLIGRRFEDFYKDEPVVGQILRQVVRERKISSLELTLASPSSPGELRKWNWILNPILDSAGEVESVSSVALEVTTPSRQVDSFLEGKTSAIHQSNAG